MKNIIRGMIFIVMLLSLSGCTDIDGKLESASRVNRKVATEVVNEKYSFVSVEHHDDERPKRDIYTYQSQERNLTFEALSTLQSFGIDGSVLGYKKFVDVKYVEAVQNYYAKEMDEILKDFDRDEHGRLIYHSFEELERIAEAIFQLSEVYKAELHYNTEEWMKKNPLCKISFCFERVECDGYYISVFALNVDGTLQCEEVYKYITYKHAEAAKSGLIKDDSIPEDQLQRVHEASLESIFYNGDNLSKHAVEKALNDRLYNNIDSTYYSYYYYPWDTYVILIDCGLTDENYAPKWMEAYADAFGFPCDVQYKKGKISWTYESSEYQIIAKDKEKHITDFKIYKDGVDLKIPYITCDSELSPVGASYLVAVPIDQFADLFHKEYEIKEENKNVEFTDCWDVLWDSIEKNPR